MERSNWWLTDLKVSPFFSWIGKTVVPKSRQYVMASIMPCYNDLAIYVIFKVDDQYIKALSQDYQSSVYRDGCVKFSFTPAGDVTSGYFNLETNCVGTMLVYHQLARGRNSKPLTDAELDQTQRAGSLPRRIKEEIRPPTTWTLEYRLPISILANILT